VVFDFLVAVTIAALLPVTAVSQGDSGLSPTRAKRVNHLAQCALLLGRSHVAQLTAVLWRCEPCFLEGLAARPVPNGCAPWRVGLQRPQVSSRMALWQYAVNFDRLPLRLSFEWPVAAGRIAEHPVMFMAPCSTAVDAAASDPDAAAADRAGTRQCASLPRESEGAAERAILGLAAEQARQLAVLKLEITRDRVPCMQQAREHLVRIEVEEGTMTLEEKAKAAAIAYYGVANSNDEGGKCTCGHCHQCLTKAALIPIRDTLLLYCLALCGHRDRKACISVMQGALDGKWSLVVESQLLNAYKHLMASIPGAFRSHNSSSGRKRQQKSAREADLANVAASALAGAGSVSATGAPDVPGTLGTSGALSASGGLGVTDTPGLPRSGRLAPLPPRTSQEQVGVQPFSLVGSSSMYLTCSFVPVGLACEESLKVQINGLLSQMVPDYSGPVLCANCAGALSARLGELRTELLWSGAGAELTARVLGVLSSVRARLVTNANVQWRCSDAMLCLLRRRGDALALQLSVPPADHSSAIVQDLDAKISRQVLGAVLGSRQAERGPVLRSEELRLLALTQKLSTVVEVVADDANAFEDILDELHDSLFWCLVRCLSYTASRDNQWHEHAKNLVRSIAKQRTMLADTSLLETESWASKALLLKRWSDDRELQTRCMLACLLFGAERAVFGSLKESVDCNWLTSVCRAIQSLHELELLGAEAARSLVELLLDWRREGRAQRLFDADTHGSLQGEYVSTLGSLLRGSMLCLERAGEDAPGSGLAAFSHVAVDAILDIGNRCSCGTGVLSEGRAALHHTSLAALDAIFEGTSQGEWEQRIAQLSVH
jgi:hypothetical protein